MSPRTRVLHKAIALGLVGVVATAGLLHFNAVAEYNGVRSESSYIATAATAESPSSRSRSPRPSISTTTAPRSTVPVPVVPLPAPSTVPVRVVPVPPPPAVPVPPPSTAPVPVVAAPPTTLAVEASSICTITYTLDGLSSAVAGRAFAAVEAQAPVIFVPAAGPPMIHVRSYWPADNPTSALGWTGLVDGTQSIYLNPLLENLPDLEVRMFVHELGHVLGLGHTASGTVMDDMPQTDQFTPDQQERMVSPC